MYLCFGTDSIVDKVTHWDLEIIESFSLELLSKNKELSYVFMNKQDSIITSEISVYRFGEAEEELLLMKVQL